MSNVKANVTDGLIIILLRKQIKAAINGSSSLHEYTKRAKKSGGVLLASFATYT